MDSIDDVHQAATFANTGMGANYRRSVVCFREVAIKKIVDGCAGWVWRDKLCLYLEEWFADML